jgi:hypothetical protein
MALVIIAVQDMPDGTVSVRLNIEPHPTPEPREFTPAERMGAVALNAIHGAIEEVKPRLLVVGADGMPH